MSPDIKARPILFSAPMVRALTSDAKTQTRRIINPQPSDNYLGYILERDRHWFKHEPTSLEVRCPYGRPGDLLWVREASHLVSPYDPLLRTVYYKADGTPDLAYKPSIHMPRWASRLTLEITDVRVERLQDISKNDCYEEGIDRPAPLAKGSDVCARDNARTAYRDLWESINGPASWAGDPWCWVISFRVHKQNLDTLLAERRSA